MNQNRRINLDLLKICAYISVVCLHVTAIAWYAVDVNTWQWQIVNAFRGTWGVPVFVMVSGCFLLDPNRRVDGRKLRKYSIRAGVAFAVWSVFYECYQIFVSYPSQGITEINWKWEVIELMTGEYHLWYLVMLVGLYLATPFLRKICEDRKLIRGYLALFFVFQSLNTYGVQLPSIGALISPVISNMGFRIAMGYTGYMVLGYYISSGEISPKVERISYAAGVLCLVGATMLNGAYTRYRGVQTVFFTQELTPNMIVASGAIFMFFAKRLAKMRLTEKIAGRIMRIEKLGFGAYLVHALFVNLLRNFGMEFFVRKPLLWIPVLTVLIAAASLGCAAVLKKIPVVGKYIA